MKIRIELHYLPTEKVFYSKEITVNETEYKSFQVVGESINKLEYLTFEGVATQYYFPENVLKNSVFKIHKI